MNIHHSIKLFEKDATKPNTHPIPIKMLNWKWNKYYVDDHTINILFIHQSHLFSKHVHLIGILKLINSIKNIVKESTLFVKLVLPAKCKRLRYRFLIKKPCNSQSGAWCKVQSKKSRDCLTLVLLRYFYNTRKGEGVVATPSLDFLYKTPDTPIFATSVQVWISSIYWYQNEYHWTSYDVTLTS